MTCSSKPAIVRTTGRLPSADYLDPKQTVAMRRRFLDTPDGPSVGRRFSPAFPWIGFIERSRRILPLRPSIALAAKASLYQGRQAALLLGSLRQEPIA
jgi:hypothetical protein